MFHAQQEGKQDSAQKHCRLAAQKDDGEQKDAVEKAIVLEVDVIYDEQTW